MTDTQQASDDEGIALTKIHGAEEEAPSVGHEAASPSNRKNERSAEVQLNNGWVGKRISVGGISGGIRGGISFHHHYHDQEPSNLHVNSDGNDEGKVLHEAITLPQSTHTLLFTEKVFSIPFAFAFLVLALSISCLALALCDNLAGNTPDNPLKVPSNVTPSVRAAQFLSIVIAVLMEEEIPTGLYLLRVIPRSTVEGILGVSYWKFVVSAMIRLVVGYMFLLNVLLVIIQSEGVLDMFYDMLALQFVSMIDDISFKLAQLDILGKSLRNAASATCFRTELERRPYLFRKKMTIFVKSVFALNFLFLLACITSVTIFQKMGHFQCEDITVTFGDHIWEESWVETGPGEHKNMVLVYSYFNGVYRKTGTQDGRPVYKELRKSEDSHFGYRHTGAEIKYCKEERVWAFTHEKIKKTQFSEETSCPWLVRSPDTDAYDLLDVSRDWEVWVGVINHDAEISVTCNGCDDEIGCNLNGYCTKDKKCVCTNKDYLEGTQCELRTPCPRLFGEAFNHTLSAVISQNCQGYVYTYGRPTYNIIGDDNIRLDTPAKIDDGDLVSILYSGSRWLVLRLTSEMKMSTDQVEGYSSDFHAFWDGALYNGTVAVSDPTTGSTPVGVDFYTIGKKGDQYGPFGVLNPIQQPPGSGNFRCVDGMTKSMAVAQCKNQSKI